MLKDLKFGRPQRTSDEMIVTLSHKKKTSTKRKTRTEDWWQSQIGSKFNGSYGWCFSRYN